MCHYTWLSQVTGTCPPGPAFPLYSLPLGWRGLTEKPICYPQHGDNKVTMGLQVPSVVCSWQGMRLEDGWRSLPVCFVNICTSAHPHGPVVTLLQGMEGQDRTGWDGRGVKWPAHETTLARLQLLHLPGPEIRRSLRWVNLCFSLLVLA